MQVQTLPFEEMKEYIKSINMKHMREDRIAIVVAFTISGLIVVGMCLFVLFGGIAE